MQIFRALIKFFLGVYVTVINLIFIGVFYVLIKSIAYKLLPSKAILYIHEHFNPFLIEYLPYIVLIVFTLYCISPINVWWMRQRLGYERFRGSDEKRLDKLVAEIGIDKKLKLYSCPSPSPNAMTFGSNTVGITSGMMCELSDEEIKGVICHEYGHILHNDFVFAVCYSSLESFGLSSLKGIFYLVEIIASIAFFIPIVIFPFLRHLLSFSLALWWAIFSTLEVLIYGISHLLYANINKYSEYRCDRYALDYGQGEGLMLFLKRIKEYEDAEKDKPSWLERLFAEHPSTKNRIKRLEKGLRRQIKNRERFQII